MENITICITTFGRRFDKFEILLDYISKQFIDSDIIVAINGEYNQEFDDNYRRKILNKIAETKNCFPIMFTEFRSLSKLWNSMIIFSKTNYNLILNDDVLITNNNLIKDIQKHITEINSCFFTINGSFSHFVISKTECDNIGYFDERLLTIGDEDGDMTWRHIEKYGKDIDNLRTIGIQNIAYDHTTPPINIKTHHLNKPIFNHTFINNKYKLNSGTIKGMFGSPAEKIIQDEKQYPYEMFYIKNKTNISEGKKIIF